MRSGRMIAGGEERLANWAGIATDGEDVDPWTAGKHECSRIVVYWENGEMAPVPWVRIEFDNGTTIHVAAAHMMIGFGE